MNSESAISIIRLLILAMTEVQRLQVDQDRLRAIFAKVRAESRDVSADELDALEAEALGALDELDRAIAERRITDGGVK